MYTAYMNANGTGIATVSGSLLKVVQFCKKYVGFYLIKRGDRDVGVYTTQRGFEMF